MGIVVKVLLPMNKPTQKHYSNNLDKQFCKTIIYSKLLNAFKIDLTKGKFIIKKLWRGVVKRSREIKAKLF
jgi:hypothetical protein